MKRIEVTVEAGKSETADEAMAKMERFTELCLKYDINFVRAEGREMVLSGRPRKVAKFQQKYERLSLAGLV